MSTNDDPNPQAFSSPAFAYTPESLTYIATHVIFPPIVPDEGDYTPENNILLARAVCAAARAYNARICGTSGDAQWYRITKMLDHLQASVEYEAQDNHLAISQLREMRAGDILAFFVRPQSAAIVLNRGECFTLCEAFEVSPGRDANINYSSGPSSFLCSYPGSAFEVPNEVFDNVDIRSRLARFLSQSDPIDLGLTLPSPAHLQYINILLDGILRGVGHGADFLCSNSRVLALSDVSEGVGHPPNGVSRITKHIHSRVRDNFNIKDRIKGVWRRSPLWLLIRVVIQMSVERNIGRTSYKQFVLFFMCIIASDRNNTSLSTHLLHSMPRQLLRRLSKLGSTTPGWLSEMVQKTCNCLREILDTKWMGLNARSSPFWNPSQDDLARDTELLLLDSRGHIRDTLENPFRESTHSPFSPIYRCRGTIEDFLSLDGTFFNKAYDIDPNQTLYDVERIVEEGIDDWLAHVTKVDGACVQLGILLDVFLSKLAGGLQSSPEDYSIKLLTGIELYVALDKLIVREIPLLAEYHPEIPIACLESFFLRETTSLHRLSCAYQYLSARHSRSHPGWSVLSNEFTEDSFPVRYYNQSAHLQRWPMAGQRLADRPETSQSNSTSSLHEKVIIFEQNCPPCIRAWRSATAFILDKLCEDPFRCFPKEDGYRLVTPPLQQVEYYQLPLLKYQIHCVYFYSDFRQTQDDLTLRYIVQGPFLVYPSIWEPNWTWAQSSWCMSGAYPMGDQQLDKYGRHTSHTPNKVLAALATCPMDLSLDGFIAFTHLRSGGSLQWFNILQALRSRSLNFRDRRVHFLLSRAAFQVGPLDLITGTWVWHQQLQDSPFCDVLLDELDNLSADVGAGSIDGVSMDTISILLTRVLASSPSDNASERAATLLRSIRRKTFSWVQELSYNLTMAPTSKARRVLLVNMALTCRSTSDVDPASHPELLRSAEDVDALLSCTFFLHALQSAQMLSFEEINMTYTRLLLCRDRRVSFAIENSLRDAILADVSNHGIDLALCKIFATYQPGPRWWEELQNPNAHWLTCQTKATKDRPLQMVHVNLLNGELRADGHPLGGLPNEVWDSPELQEIFRDQGFFVVPSDLPGMYFTTFSTGSTDYKVHFSWRDGCLVIRARHSQTNEILELIPSHELQSDLPPALVDGHVHWLNITRKIIEIRSLNRLWVESSENWKIDCASGRYRMEKGHEALVDIRSSTWAMISKCFGCLNHLVRDSDSNQLPLYWRNQNRNLLVTTTTISSTKSSSQLTVNLPHYSLTFFVNGSGELESRDFDAMVYDENQSIGTLFGLENLLVLRRKTHTEPEIPVPEALIHRRVLIPNSNPVLHGDHWVRIEVNFMYNTHDSLGEPYYHIYDVNTELGCLTGNGSLRSMRFLAFLHGMTNWHRPDPLTGKTGAQAALCLLRSGGCLSIMGREYFMDPETQIHEIRDAYWKICSRYYWHRDLYQSYSGSWLKGFDVQTNQTAGRALFPSDIGLNFLDSHKYDHPTTRNPMGPGPLILPPLGSSLLYTFNASSPMEITLDHLICNRTAPQLANRRTRLRSTWATSANGLPALDQLFSSLRAHSSFQREYLTHLDASSQCVLTESRTTHQVAKGHPIDKLKEHYAQCRANYLNSLNALKEVLGPAAASHEHELFHWPTITASVLLRYLASASPLSIPPQWKVCLTSFALLLLDLQRARRLFRYALDGLEEEFLAELENEGCDGWDAENYPDWLLIQIQGDFLIRRTQAEAAMELMFPESEDNSVIQVNMGEGKSSVIIPIAAAALADGKKLVRIIVPGPLIAQMSDLLVSRLGWLVNRPIYHLPFSRNPSYDTKNRVISLQIDDLKNLTSQCMSERGIMLVQPEHVVSVKLKGIEEQLSGLHLMPSGNRTTKYPRYMYKGLATAMSLRSMLGDNFLSNVFRSLGLSPDHSSEKNNTQVVQRDEEDAHGDPDNALKWLRLQGWLNSYARFQLIYTLGLQQHLDGYPNRWRITQQILRLVKKHVYSLSRYIPGSIECKGGPPGSFPHVRILRRSDVDSRLISLITENVMDGGLPQFNFRYGDAALHDAIRSFISDKGVLRIPETARTVEARTRSSDRSHLWDGLLLLRGLLTSDILLFALAERRWRVDYGLVPQVGFSKPSSTTLAVPYRAKDTPALNTQFGHPDLTIILTCLSYYYSGLTEEQLRTSFEILQDQDDPYIEYILWLKEYDPGTVPDSLQKLGDINLRSSNQWDKVVFPLFAYNQAVIDFYLSQVVFPKEAKGFPWKLAASSWDLAEKRENVVTGLSGTNDGRWLLPMSITQRNLDHQKGTNAKVLAYLLQPDNDYMVTHADDEHWNTRAFLLMLAEQRPGIRVLLDVGSQILDLSNTKVAAAWLEVSREAAGAIYFNGQDELTVLTRNGTMMPLSSSAFSQQLGRCVVYLDHAHTRGTDIKLPIGSRAAVTLGPKVTKDALVQGCMRMRKLGRGHSVMFFASPEVDRSIRTAVDKTDPKTPVTTVDILCWAIYETWSEIQQRAPYWARQGMNHKSRYEAWSKFINGRITREKLADAWLQPEQKSLAELYSPSETKCTSGDLSALDPAIRQRCKDLGALSVPDAQMDEEQEREVHREREREREMELPPEAEPAEHSLHPDVVSFVRTGVLPPLYRGSAFLPIFTTLERSTAATHDGDVWSSSILATVDFCTTVKPESTTGTMDQYLRPVQWILSRAKPGAHDQVLVLLSPFEVDRLLPDIRVSKCVHLHLYAPRTSERMKSSDDLKLYTIPPLPSDWTPPWHLIDQLNVFAGQLYIRDYQSYLRVCRFLGVPTKEPPNDHATIRRNLFNIPGSFEEMEIMFSGSPLPFVMALLAIRTRGKPFEHTHMGRILQGQILKEKDFERPLRSEAYDSAARPARESRGTPEASRRPN